jgi:hypothetical protein
VTGELIPKDDRPEVNCRELVNVQVFSGWLPVNSGVSGPQCDRLEDESEFVEQVCA